MYTVRNLVADAYGDSNVIGVGMTASAREMRDGVSWLNSILDSLYTSSEFSPTVSAETVTFSGASEYTIGPMPDLSVYPNSIIPDFIVPIMPSDISTIAFISGNNARLMSRRCDPAVFFGRPVNNVQNPFPAEFYYERKYPYGIIRFRMGTPQGQGELIYSPSYTGVAENTDLDFFPIGLKPYLRYKLAADISVANRLDETPWLIRANQALDLYTRSNYKKQNYMCDFSAPGSTPLVGKKYNIYAPADLVGF